MGLQLLVWQHETINAGVNHSTPWEYPETRLPEARVAQILISCSHPHPRFAVHSLKHLHMHKNIHVRTDIYMRTYKCTYIQYIYIYKYKYKFKMQIQIHMHIHIHIYSHICAHVHIYVSVTVHIHDVEEQD